MSANFAPSIPQRSMLSTNGNQRILALVFPHLPTDRIARQRWGLSWRSAGRPEYPPVVCAGRLKNAMRLQALDETAEKAGLKKGQGVAEARAICPVIEVIPTDEVADRRFLEALADWCDRYTPLVALDGDDGLFLDITGCSHLMGGEAALLDDILKRLFQLGLDARGAISSAPGLSWAVARFGDAAGPTIIGDAEIERVLSPLPMTALRLNGDTIATLLKVGLKQIGDILGAPRAPLARRFGSQLLLRLDQAVGLDEEVISPRRPVASLSCERRLAQPVSGEQDLLCLAELLATSLKVGLEARGLGGRLFELLLFRVDGRVFRIAAGASLALREPKRIAALFSERFTAVHDDLDVGYGFETIRLNVLEALPFESEQADFTKGSDHGVGLAGFIDQAVARLGRDSILRPELRESHIPERAATMVVAFGLAVPVKTATQVAYLRAERPVRLFRNPELVEAVAEVPEGPPVHFRWRRTLHRVARAEGPERLAAEWWIDGEDAPTRDYFRIEDDAGRRYWLYREGLYEREKISPRWFMHGIFA